MNSISRATVLFIGAVALLWLGAAGEIAAQTYQGGIRGAVHDPGGVVPRAEVTLVNEATNARRTTFSNDVGEYVFANVLPGTYTVRITIQGFSLRIKRIRSEPAVHRPRRAAGVGSAAERSVRGSPIIENANASVPGSLDSKILETLPTAGRNAFFLSVTTPNVIPTGIRSSCASRTRRISLLSLGGGPRRATTTLEGVSITDLRNRATFIPPSKRSTSEGAGEHLDAEMDGRAAGSIPWASQDRTAFTAAGSCRTARSGEGKFSSPGTCRNRTTTSGYGGSFGGRS